MAFNPLKKEHLDAANAGLREIYEVQEALPKLRLCGMNCEEIDTMCQELRQALEAVKGEFFGIGVSK